MLTTQSALFDQSLEYRSRLLSKGLTYEEREQLQEELVLSESDLAQLLYTTPSHDPLHNLFILFLARCRATTLSTYRIRRFIGAGQCGAVYEAFDEHSGLSVAVKILLFPRNDEEIMRFENEATVLQQLDHTAIIRGLTGPMRLDHLPISWYAMELATDAISLEEYLVDQHIDKCLSMITDACYGLQYAHDKNVVHRDLHLNNIVITSEDKPKILDFGSAKYGDSGHTFGPIGAMVTSSPEKLADPMHVSGKADVYAIGAIMYRIVTGSWPFYADTFGQFYENAQQGKIPTFSSGSDALDKLICRCLDIRPEARPTAGELASELASIREQ